MNELIKDNLTTKIYETRDAMGRGAAEDVRDKLIELLEEKDEVNVIFASAPSQNEFLKYLSQAEGVEWNRVNVFHMDEYIGLSPDHPQRFSNFLKVRLFDKLDFKNTFLLNPDENNLEASCNQYASLLKQFPLDIVCMGIGENSHIAFNDPHVADFNDSKLVKVVQLESTSRHQQVNDGCFPSIDEVPQMAVTLTIPILVSADYIFCVVPGPSKTDAVNRTINEDINEKYPSTILRQHPNAIMYVDEDSAAELEVEEKKTS